MKLRYIISSVLLRKIGEYEYPHNAGYNWDFNTYFISDYLSIEIRKFKIEIPEYKQLRITICKKPTQEICCSYAVTPTIQVFVPFSQEDMDKLTRTTNFEERIETYLSVFEQGYQIANRYYDIQIEKLLSLHQKFRENSYRHEWLFKKKIIKEYGIYVFFKCYLTSVDFRLELEVYDQKQTEMLTKGVVIQTAPDRVCFWKEFNKGIRIENGKMYLLDFLDYPNYEFDLEKLSKGIFNVTYKQKIFEWRDTICQINWLEKDVLADFWTRPDIIFRQEVL